MFANTFKLDSRPTWEMETLTHARGRARASHSSGDRPGTAGTCRNSARTRATPRLSKAGRFTPSRSARRWASIRIPYSKFGRLTYEMWRAIRLVVDTGLHAMGWTREQAIDFFRANAAEDRSGHRAWKSIAISCGRARRSATRWDSSRFASCARRRARAWLTLRRPRFHDIVLGQGAVPLDVLEGR